MLDRKLHTVSTQGKVLRSDSGEGEKVVVVVVVVRVRGYLLSSRECMVETGHISHNGFLIRTSSVHNVYKVG